MYIAKIEMSHKKVNIVRDMLYYGLAGITHLPTYVTARVTCDEQVQATLIIYVYTLTYTYMVIQTYM